MEPPIRYLHGDEISPSVDLASYWRYHGYRFEQYALPGHHFILIEQGKIIARTSDGKMSAGPGSLYCFRPADPNIYTTRGDMAFYQAHVLFAPPPRHALTPWLDGIGPLPVMTKLGDSFDDARKVFETICLEIPRGGAQHAMRLKSAIFELLAIIAGVTKGRPEQVKYLDPWQRVRMQMESELNGELRIAELARQMGISTDHFIRRFKDRFGASPRAYHTQLRLREAARLLRDRDRSVKNVSYALGFPDPRAFARLLKRHVGLKPSDLRLTQGATVEPESVRSDGRLIPVNRHLSPPSPSGAPIANAGDAWFDKWGARRPISH